MPTSSMAFLGTPAFQINFILGLIIVVLYVKEKFNVPTYDTASLGPFASLPPGSLTLSTRYRRGQSLYTSMLVALYAAVCLIGPITFGDPTFAGQVAQAGAAAPAFAAGLQLGPVFKDTPRLYEKLNPRSIVLPAWVIPAFIAFLGAFWFGVASKSPLRIPRVHTA